MGEGYINPNCLERVKKFQRTFVKYFPDFDDLQVAATEWSWLHSHWICNGIATVRRAQVMGELGCVVRALRLIAKCNMPWAMNLYDAKRAPEAEGADQITRDHAIIAEAIIDLHSMDEDGALEAALTRFQDAAEGTLRHLPDTGNTNWDAVFAVDALRTVWWRNTDNDAPAKALNPASEFASYLRDGFRWLKVEANPVAAFRRWAKWRCSIDPT
jgi:hypothetical protein